MVDSLAQAVAQNRTALLALTALKNYDNYTFTHMVNVSILTMGQARGVGHRRSAAARVRARRADARHRQGQDAERDPEQARQADRAGIRHPQAAHRGRRADPAQDAGDADAGAGRRVRASPARRRHRLPERRARRSSISRRRCAASPTSTTRCDRSACISRRFPPTASSPCCSATTASSSTSIWSGDSCSWWASTRSGNLVRLYSGEIAVVLKAACRRSLSAARAHPDRRPTRCRSANPTGDQSVGDGGRATTTPSRRRSIPRITASIRCYNSELLDAQSMTITRCRIAFMHASIRLPHACRLSVRRRRSDSTCGAARRRFAAPARHRRRRSAARRLPPAVQQALAQRIPHAARSGHGVRERALSVSRHRHVRRSRDDRHRRAAARARHDQQHVVAAEGARAHRMLRRSGDDGHHLRPADSSRQQRRRTC